MPVRRTIPEKNGVHFITFTCAQWLPLFKLSDSYDAVYKWFDHLKANGHFIVGYIIMPSHAHAIIAFHNTGRTINSIVGNGKRFMAYDIVERMKKQKWDKLLTEMQSMVNNMQKAMHKQHEVFEPSFDWKECRTEKFIIQKLNYIHSNPCKGENRLATQPEEYIHSSAKFYITGEQGICAVIPYTELQDIDLTK